MISPYTMFFPSTLGKVPRAIWKRAVVWLGWFVEIATTPLLQDTADWEAWVGGHRIAFPDGTKPDEGTVI